MPDSAALTPEALSASAFENASMLRTASPTAALLSATSLSTRPSVVSALAESDCTAVRMFCMSDDSPTMTGGLPSFDVSGGESGAPPVSAIAAPPVSP